jgi:fused signal recognition particle receptor
MSSEKKGFFRRILGKEKTPQQEEPSEHEASEGLPSQEAAEDQSPPTDDVQDERRGIFRLRRGLKKTRSGFIKDLDRLVLGKREFDEETKASLEEILVKADIGVQTAYDLLEGVTDRIKRAEVDRPDLILEHLRAMIREILDEVESPLRIGFGPEPFVVMVVGVNGSGKTTTIAKMAARHRQAGGKVLMGAGDTFRAAAVEQMEIWAERVGCPVVKGKEKADPSSIAYEAVDQALRDGVDLLLVDTAGRLHTRVPLMDQLKKMRRTIQKQYPAAPHEILLVIDASTGQNAILQAKTFSEAIPVSGIALTKLDGTAKGGVLVGISNELKIPVRYVGVGEQMEDLQDFSARYFTEALFEGSDVSEEPTE